MGRLPDEPVEQIARSLPVQALVEETERGLESRVRHPDPPLLVDDHDAGRHGVEDRPQELRGVE